MRDRKSKKYKYDRELELTDNWDDVNPKPLYVTCFTAVLFGITVLGACVWVLLNIIS